MYFKCASTEGTNPTVFSLYSLQMYNQLHSLPFSLQHFPLQWHEVEGLHYHKVECGNTSLSGLSIIELC